jgi:hypothetical protein
MRVALLLSMACTVLGLAGCAELQPYRTDAPTVAYDASSTPCTPSKDDSSTDGNSGGQVAAQCAHRIREDASTYRLYFSEFDDQGWSFPKGHTYGEATRQIDVFVGELRDLIQKTDESISVVVFVHGWKHTAQTDDANVKRFRSLLESLDLVERTTGCRRHVIGLYVGWRGAATALGDPLESLSFYSRKNAAERVALGDVRVLFSQLRATQDLANLPWNEKVQRSLASVSRVAPRPADVIQPSHSQCDKRMRLSIAGHSFGGLIVYTSLAQALIRDVVDLRQAEDLAAINGTGRPTMTREGDLVVVINPAIEATRFEPLFRAVQQRDLPHYHAPLFVAITSTDDQATRTAFPLGRSFSTLWEKYAVSDDQREKRANQTTLGQDEDFLTHTLTAVAYASDGSVPTAAPGNAICKGWNVPGASFKERLDIETAESATFLQQLERNGYDAKGLFPRSFCSLDVLRLGLGTGLGMAAVNSPVWNIQTSKPIVDDHNDFDNPRLIAFFRQLYREAEFREEQVGARAK